MMNRFYFWVGIAFMIYLPVMVVWHVCHIPGRWEWGPHGIPIPLEGDVPGHHPDGTPINLVDGMILRSGYAELIYASLGAMVLVAVVSFVSLVRSTRKLRHEAEQLQKSLDLLFRQTDSPVVHRARERLASAQRKLTWFHHIRDDNH